MKQITVFGASGMVGKAMVHTALAHRYQVVAFGRSLDDLVLFQEGFPQQLQLVKGSVFELSDVSKALKGSSIVLSALGGGTTGADKTRSLGMKTIVAAMQKAAVERILALGGLGVLPHAEYGRWVDDPSYPEEYKAVGHEHLKAFEHLANSPLQYSFICSPNIAAETAVAPYSVAYNTAPVPNSFVINTGSLADYCIQNVSNEESFRQLVGICNQTTTV